MKSAESKKLKEIVVLLKKEFDPSRLFLFGSRANGSNRADSDYDFVLVIPGLKNRFAAEVKARSMVLSKFNISADIFIYSKKDFDQWKNELSSIPETALNTGKEIELG
ncbi:MAG: nucleotidyltransferase domain-containing protein [Oligoflexia bacterium]|nr:nucleotidyltransferase domain-containing protein [Oligoflexia bacterium]